MVVSTIYWPSLMEGNNSDHHQNFLPQTLAAKSPLDQMKAPLNRLIAVLQNFPQPIS